MTRDTWILIADAAHARVFAAGQPGEPWHLVHTLGHPRSAAKTSDVVTDRPGRVQQSADRRRSATEPRTPPKTVDAERNVRELADLLDAGRQHYQRLVLVAPPHFLGMLRKCLSDAVSDAVAASLDRNWTDVPDRELPDRFAAAQA